MHINVTIKTFHFLFLLVTGGSGEARIGPTQIDRKMHENLFKTISNYLKVFPGVIVL